MLIAVKSSLSCQRINVRNSDSLEFILVKTTLERTVFYFACFYIPPNSLSSVYSNVLDVLSQMYEVTSRDFVLCLGDFNLCHVDWSASLDGLPILTPSNIRPLFIAEFIDTIATDGLYQVNNVRNFMSRLLDLIFTNNYEGVSVSKCTSPLSKVDVFHEPLDIFVSITSNIRDVPSYKNILYDFRKTDFVSLNLFLGSVNWNTVFDDCSVDSATNFMYDILFVGFDHSVPLVYSQPPRKCPPWFTPHLKRLKNAKTKAHKRYCMSRVPFNYEVYARLREQFKSEQVIAYNAYIVDVQNSIASEPSKFWSYVKLKQKSSVLPAVMSYNNMSADNLPDICDLFKQFFTSVYTCGEVPSMSMSNVPPYIPLGSLHLSESDVFKALMNLDQHKRSGPDNVPPLVLVKCALTLFRPLTIIFNMSLREGIFPSMWKVSALTVIHKSGPRTDITNYRGISKMTTIGKLFESIVTDVLQDHFANYISNQQHGFVRGRSVKTNLTEFVSTASDVIVNRSQLDVVYTDFSKAFDRVNHVCLLSKLSHIGIHSSLLYWISSYLSNRRQYVCINGFKSMLINVTSGVPQGSHLGPLLFNLFVNDVVHIFKHVKCLIYADDMKLFMTVKTLSDASNFQQDLVLFCNWCTNNDLCLNVPKCKHMFFCRNRNPIHCRLFLNSERVDTVSQMRDLGVIFNSKLCFDVHIDYVISKSMSMLGFIKRICYNFSNTNCLKSIYYAHVRSHLEFASEIWSPEQDTYKRRIESVQKQFVLFVLRRTYNRFNYDTMPPYHFRCKLLNICPLNIRREHSMSIFVFDVLTNKINCPFILERLYLSAPNRLLRNSNMLSIPFCRTRYAQQEPIIRMSRHFNAVAHLFDYNISRQRFLLNLRSANHSSYTLSS